jgi:hypothetical protein
MSVVDEMVASTRYVVSRYGGSCLRDIPYDRPGGGESNMSPDKRQRVVDEPEPVKRPDGEPYPSETTDQPDVAVPQPAPDSTSDDDSDDSA